MPKKSQTQEPDFAPEQFPGTDPAAPSGNVATELEPVVAPAVKLGQQVRYVLGEHSKNAGKVRLATVAAINDDGSVGLNVILAHKDDLKLGDRVPGIQFGPVSIPLGSYIVNPAEYAPAESGKGATWHLPE